MAIQQVLTVYINLKGDAAASTFSFALQNLYQFSNGIAVPFGGAGVVPTAVSANNPPVPVTSTTVDANGNITLTTTSPLPASVFTFQLDLTFTSGASSSTSPTQSTNVLTQGEVTTSAPTYVTGQASPLSLDTSGNLRVAGSFSPSAPSDTTATGSITSTQNVVINTQGSGSVVFNVTGTWTGTITPEASVDGTNWVTANIAPVLPLAALTNTITANGQWQAPTGGFNSFRLRGNTVATGSAVVWLEAGQGQFGTVAYQSVAGNLQTTATISSTISTFSLSAPGQTAVINTLAAANAAVVLPASNTWTGTLVTEVSIDNGVTWQQVDVWDEQTESYINNAGEITVNGSYWFEPIGAMWFARVRLVTLTSGGPVTGTLIGTIAPNLNLEYSGIAGSTLPNNLVAIGGSDGTNIRAVATDTLGNQYVKGANGNPLIVQAGHTATANTSTALANAFASPNTAGNTIVVIVGVGSGTAPTSITDTLNTPATVGNSYKLLTSVANSTTFSTYIYILPGCLGGANTVTVNTASSTISSIIFEVSGLLNVRISDNAVLTGTSGQASVGPLYPTAPGELAFQAIAIGTASQTITVGSGWAGLTQVNSTVTPTGLFTLGAQYQINPSLDGAPTIATFTSEPWASAAVVFYATPALFGRVTAYNTPTSSPGNSFTPMASPGSGSNVISLIEIAGPTLLKASGGNLVGLYVQNLLTVTTSGGTQYIKFYDTNVATSAAAANYKFSIPLPSPTTASAGAFISIPPGALSLANFVSGIVVTVNITTTSSSTTGTASNNAVYWIA